MAALYALFLVSWFPREGNNFMAVEVCLCMKRKFLCSCRALKHRRGEEPGFNLTLDDFRYFNETPVSTMISDFMINASFTGISVSVEDAWHLLTHRCGKLILSKEWEYSV